MILSEAIKVSGVISKLDDSKAFFNHGGAIIENSEEYLIVICRKYHNKEVLYSMLRRNKYNVSEGYHHVAFEVLSKQEDFYTRIDWEPLTSELLDRASDTASSFKG